MSADRQRRTFVFATDEKQFHQRIHRPRQNDGTEQSASLPTKQQREFGFVYLARRSSSHRNALSSLQNSRKIDFEIGKV